MSQDKFIRIQVSREDLVFIAQILDGTAREYCYSYQDALMDGEYEIADQEILKCKRCQDLAKSIALAGKEEIG